MAKQTFLIPAAALTLLAACNGPTVPAPSPPPHPDLEAAPADLPPPPPPLLGGPPGEARDDGILAGGPYATPDRPGKLTTFRRADGVEVTVMRPIPNPEDGGPAPPRRRAHDRIGEILDRADRDPAAKGAYAQAPAPQAQATQISPRPRSEPAEALAPTQPVPPPQVVEHPRRAAPPHGAHHRVHVKPPASPKAVAPPAAAPAKPSLVDRMSQDQVPTPAGTVSPKALLGGLLLIFAMVVATAIARRLARAREDRERARRAAKRAAAEAPVEPPPAETPPEA